MRNPYNRNTFPLCYYPTTIMLVSENPRYALSLRALNEGSFIYQRYQQAQDAVQNILSALCDALPNLLNCSYKQHHTESACALNKTIQAITKRRTYPQRFAEPSVILFDATSPNPWQQACEQLQDSGVQRVLEGGTTTDILDAFNAGLIDYAMVPQEQASTLQHLQKKYFQRRMQHLLPSLQQQESWLSDPAFAHYWQTLQRQYRITEYYYINQPSGFICVTANGQSYRFIIYDDKEIEGHIDCAKDLNAPEPLLKKLQSRQHIPYFTSQDGYYNNDITEPLLSLHKAEHIKSTTNYYCGMVMINAEG